MTKKIIAFYAILSLILVGLPAWAMPNMVAVQNQASGRIVVVPQNAVEVSHGVFYLGAKVDPQSGKTVEGYAIVRYKENNVKPPKPGGGGSISCYTFLGSNAKWKTNEPWLVNPDNVSGLPSNDVSTNLTGDIAKWEDAADGVINNNNSVQILGDGSSVSYPLVADFTSPDTQNEVYFADVSQTGAIAITVVWGIFSGPPSGRELLEWDQVYDDVDFSWSMTGNPLAMDFESIATHELGHSVGLGDVYQSACSSVTMYGYAGEGEINKQTLELQDINGISTLY